MTNHQIPEKARVAVLTGAKKIEIFEFPVPEIGDDEILVKVEQTIRFSVIEEEMSFLKVLCVPFE